MDRTTIKTCRFRRLIRAVGKRERELTASDDLRLRETDLVDVFARARVAAQRALGLRPYDVQIHGGLAMASGAIAEMQTGEGKTLAAVPVAAYHALAGRGMHVMTANDYLAQRDAEWMRPIYELLGLSVGVVRQGMTADERRRSYGADVTYGSAAEFGFDFLRDRLALAPGELVQRELYAALIDEIDSILIDEARVPLVVAGGEQAPPEHAYDAARLVASFVEGLHYEVDPDGRNVRLTERGVDAADGLPMATVVPAVEAKALARRDVEYIVRNGRIELVDEFKGRTDQLRRWPAGFHTAVEAQEGLELTRNAAILGQITLQSFVRLYSSVCGMTATAQTSALEFRSRYRLPVAVIPPNRRRIRDDLPDVVFALRDDKERALVEEIASEHARGRPVLVGTASVAESEQLAERLRAANVRCTVLNARQDEAEASVIARAGAVGAVTISTNMAGRGTDITLGPGASELGGLYVIGTNRHDARRIDLQLRGRAGRQGDPGTSRSFISLEDPLFVRHRQTDLTGDVDRMRSAKRVHHQIDRAQELVDWLNTRVREALDDYGAVLERHRKQIHGWRDDVVGGFLGSRLLPGVPAETERELTLAAIDIGWTAHLAEMQDLRTRSIRGHSSDAVREYAAQADEIFEHRLQSVRRHVGELHAERADVIRPSAKWTYLLDEVPSRTQMIRWPTLVRVMLRDGFSPYTEEEEAVNARA